MLSKPPKGSEFIILNRPEDPMIPFDLEESSKRMYLHLRRKEPRGAFKRLQKW